MAVFDDSVSKINTARYGKDVRQSFVDALKECYKYNNGDQIDTIMKTFLHASGNPYYITSNIADARYKNLNTVPQNSILVYNIYSNPSVFTNRPGDDWHVFQLITFGNASTEESGVNTQKLRTQIAINKDGSIASRFSWGDPNATYFPWTIYNKNTFLTVPDKYIYGPDEFQASFGGYLRRLPSNSMLAFAGFKNSNMPADVPDVKAHDFFVYTFGSNSKDNAPGLPRTQVFVDAHTNQAYFRSKWSSKVTDDYSQWALININGYGLGFNIMKPAVIQNTSGEDISKLDESLFDLNTVPSGSVLVYDLSDTSQFKNLPTYDGTTYRNFFLLTFGGKNNKLLTQIVIQRGTYPIMLFRILWGDGVSTKWTKLSDDSTKTVFPSTTSNLVASFAKVCCVGDSYTAGAQPYDHDHQGADPDYAYPACISRMTGRTWVNAGLGGVSCKTWMSTVSNHGGLDFTKKLGKVQAYYVALGINDRSHPQNKVPVGTKDDIGKEADTYYAQYSKLIRELHAISPEAFIFCATRARDRDAFDQAIVDIVNNYKTQGYRICLIDFNNTYRDLWDDKFISQGMNQGHFLAVGYERMAETIRIAVSDYMAKNVRDFNVLSYIPYDK